MKYLRNKLFEIFRKYFEGNLLWFRGENSMELVVVVVVESVTSSPSAV